MQVKPDKTYDLVLLRAHRVGRLLQHDGDEPRADLEAGPRAPPRAAPRRLGARVRALTGIPGRLRVPRIHHGQAQVRR